MCDHSHLTLGDSRTRIYRRFTQKPSRNRRFSLVPAPLNRRIGLLCNECEFNRFLSISTFCRAVCPRYRNDVPITVTKDSHRTGRFIANPPAPLTA